MASTIASLFGPSAEQIVYDRQQAERDRADAEFYRGLQFVDVPGVSTGMVAGRGIARGLGQVAEGLFGGSAKQDPRLARALKLEELFKGTDVNDLSDPDKVAALSNNLAESGMIAEALYFADRAKDLTAQQIQLQKLTQPTLAKDLITNDGRLVATDTFGGLYDYETNERLTKNQVQLATTYKAAQKPAEAASGTAQKQAINFLKERTDLSIGDLNPAGTALANIANSIEGVDDYNQALEQAFLKMQQEQKLTDTGFEVFGIGSKWGWNPEGVAVPLRPTTSGDQDWKVLSDETTTSNTVPRTTKLR